MPPKEKAYQLVLKFQFKQEGIRKELAKRSCLIAVEEIINLLNSDINPLVNYWYEVKQEIENL
jgi:hypothetical protein